MASLEELLVTAPNLHDDSDIFQMVPCGHCRARLAWMNSKDQTQHLCSVCKTILRDEALLAELPTRPIAGVLRDMKEECKQMENDALDRRDMAAILLPKRNLPITRPPSPVPSTLRDKLNDLPARLLGKPGSIRRPSTTTEEIKSLLTNSSEPVEFRGMLSGPSANASLDGPERGKINRSREFS